MPILRNVLSRFFNERFFDQAAQTAYYLLLSTLPFLIFILSMLSLFPVNEEMILNFLKPFVPVEAFRLVEGNVQMIVRKGQGNLIYTSLAVAFWISSVAVQSLARSLDLAYGHVRSSPFWKFIIRDLGITLLFMIVIPLGIMATTSGFSFVVNIPTGRGWDSILVIEKIFCENRRFVMLYILRL